MEQPLGWFVDPTKPNLVCKLQRGLYGLKPSPRAWYSKLSSFSFNWGFVASKADTSMFTYNSFRGSLIILVYVDDILVTGSNFVLMQRPISTLNDQFALNDLGDIHYFLGAQAYQNGSCLHLCQTKYIQNLLIWTSMQASKPLSSPMFSSHPLSLRDGAFIIWSFCVQKSCWNTPVLHSY